MTTMLGAPAAGLSAKSGLPLYSTGLSALGKKKALFIRFAKGSLGRWRKTRQTNLKQNASGSKALESLDYL